MFCRSQAASAPLFQKITDVACKSAFDGQCRDLITSFVPNLKSAIIVLQPYSRRTKIQMRRCTKSCGSHISTVRLWIINQLPRSQWHLVSDIKKNQHPCPTLTQSPAQLNAQVRPQSSWRASDRHEIRNYNIWPLVLCNHRKTCVQIKDTSFAS